MGQWVVIMDMSSYKSDNSLVRPFIDVVTREKIELMMRESAALEVWSRGSGDMASSLLAKASYFLRRHVRLKVQTETYSS